MRDPNMRASNGQAAPLSLDTRRVAAFAAQCLGVAMEHVRLESETLPGGLESPAVVRWVARGQDGQC